LAKKVFGLFSSAEQEPASKKSSINDNPIGLIAGNTSFPLQFARAAKKAGRSVVALAHKGETLPEITETADVLEWIKVGELGKIIDVFKAYNVREAVMAGGINRIRLFGGVKLDARGAALLYRLRSTKDDVIMRGIADELAREGVNIIPCTLYFEDCMVKEGVLTKALPTEEQREDVRVGIDAIRAMGGQDIGQLVVVREGVIVAVEAVEGSDAAILRGGALGGKGTVIVKCAKPTQDMRFDVPTVGLRTIETMVKAGAKVLALEASRSLIVDEKQVLALADKHQIVVLGCPPLTK